MNDPNMVYIIVSLMEMESPDVKGYKIEKSGQADVKVTKIELEIS